MSNTEEVTVTCPRCQAPILADLDMMEQHPTKPNKLVKVCFCPSCHASNVLMYNTTNKSLMIGLPSWDLVE